MRLYVAASLVAGLVALMGAVAAPAPATSDRHLSATEADELDQLAPPDVPDGDPQDLGDAPARPDTDLSEAENEELNAEAAAYADDYGGSVPQARARLKAQSSLSRLARGVRAAVDSRRMAGVSISHLPEPRLVVRLTQGPVPPSVGDLDDDRVVVTTDAVLSLAERTEAATLLSEQWYASIPSLDGWYIDEASDRVVLSVTDTADVQAAQDLVREPDFRTTSGESAVTLELAVEQVAPLSLDNKGGRDLQACSRWLRGQPVR